jgi:Tfp pilus assembly protein PilO
VTFDLVRTSAAVALAVALAGYVLVVRPLEASLSERYAELDAARATLEQRLLLTARIPALERERVRLAAVLRRFHTGDRRAATIDRFLSAIARVSSRDGVAVQRVAAGAVAPFAPATGTTQAALVDEVPLDVTLRGAYSDIIRAARDVNDGDVATRVTLASLANAGRRPGERSELNAAFHVLLLREPDATTHDLQPH